MRRRTLFWKCIWRLGILENNEHLLRSIHVIIGDNKIEQVRAIVKACKECQLVRQTGSIRSNVEDLKNIPICDLFYKVAFDTTRPLPKPTRETSIFLLPLTTILNGVKQKLYRITL